MALMEEELTLAEHVVALKRDEHWPMLVEKFPGWVERVEFWQVHDIDMAHPQDALPQIEREVLGLLERLALQHRGSSF
jgi:protein-tyrosine phosphatase